MALCLICLGGFITTTFLQVQAYFDYRTWLTLKIVREPFKFPAVTICNNNNILLSKLNTRDPELLYALYILSQPPSEDMRPVNLTLRQLSDRIGPDLDVSYKSCVLKSHNVPCSHLFHSNFDHMVIKCYTFDPNKFKSNQYPGLAKVERQGMGSGLEIQLDCHMNDYAGSLTERAIGIGFIVSY